MSTFTFENEKYALKPFMYEGRQFSLIFHVEAILEGFQNRTPRPFAHGPLSLQHLFIYGGNTNSHSQKNIHITPST